MAENAAQEPNREALEKIWRRIAAAFYCALIAWLVITIVVSIASKVFEPIVRSARVPKVPLVILDTPEKKAECRVKMSGFFAEFNKHADLFHVTSKSSPKLAYHEWRSWFAQWRDSLSDFGARYNFLRDGSSEPCKDEELKSVFLSLVDFADGFDRTAADQYKLYEENYEKLKRQLKKPE